MKPAVVRSGEAVGVEGVDPKFIPLIPEGSTLPASHVEIFTTAVDNQSEVTVTLFARAEQLGPRPLGTFVVDGLAPVRAGFAQVIVTIRVDPDGTVRAAALDKATGRETRKQLGQVAVTK